MVAPRRHVEVDCPVCGAEQVEVELYGDRQALVKHRVPGTRFPCPYSHGQPPHERWRER